MRLSIPKSRAHVIRSSYPCHSPWRRWSNWFQLGLWGNLRKILPNWQSHAKKWTNWGQTFEKFWNFPLVSLVGPGLLGILYVFAFSLLQFRNIEKLFYVCIVSLSFCFLFIYHLFVFIFWYFKVLPGLSTQTGVPLG